MVLGDQPLGALASGRPAAGDARVLHITGGHELFHGAGSRLTHASSKNLRTRALFLSADARRASLTDPSSRPRTRFRPSPSKGRVARPWAQMPEPAELSDHCEPSVSGYSVSYSRPRSSILCRYSSFGGGGGDEGSVAGTPASSKNPSKPAGQIKSSVLAGSSDLFFQACGVPLGMRKTESASARSEEHTSELQS